MLIPQHKFTGLDTLTHLATGGESPALKSHLDAVQQFFTDKSCGEKSRAKIEATYRRTQEKTAALFNVEPDSIAFLDSASAGVNLLAYALKWQAGDNVIVADVEFPSDVLPWTKFTDQGVELRIVNHKNWHISLDDLIAQIDDHTRVIAVSLVSYFTGQRHNMQELAARVRQANPNTILLVDATHAAGVMPVDAAYADIVISSCYKWLLGVHGTAIFYWNRKRLPHLAPPFVGWATPAQLPSWENPTAYELPQTADRFVPANPTFIGLYILENALDHLLPLGRDTIAEYVLELSGRLWHGVHAQGWEMMTPEPAEARAGNVCFLTPNVNELTAAMEEAGILIWGAYGGVKRVRISTHLFNTAAEVDKCLAVLKNFT